MQNLIQKLFQKLLHGAEVLCEELVDGYTNGRVPRPVRVLKGVLC